MDTLFTGLWKLPGKSGDRPNTAFVSAYRDIDYDTVEDAKLERAAQLAGIPFGANPNSWQATPTNGRRNTLKILDGVPSLNSSLSVRLARNMLKVSMSVGLRSRLSLLTSSLSTKSATIPQRTM